jgi:hypothetical protein
LPGRVLSWLIVCEQEEDNKERRISHIELFAEQILSGLLKIDTGILTKLIVDFFRAVVTNHLHELVIDFFEEIFDNLRKDLLYVVRLHFLRFIVGNLDRIELFLNILRGYDRKTRESLLFQIKMDLECPIGMFMHGEFKHEWESKRYQNIGNQHIATVVMTCNKCNWQSAEDLDLLVFLGVRDFGKHFNVVEFRKKRGYTCKKCGNKRCFLQ